MINKLFWNIVAYVISRPFIVDWLIKRALKTPYSHIMSRDGAEMYMERYWLFNPYPSEAEKNARKAQGLDHKVNRLPSIRLHKIMREDFDRDLHDHPWDARTIILRGMYIEERLNRPYIALWDFEQQLVTYIRRAGDTATIKFNEYHQIVMVPKEGVWTLFITYKYQGVWGFLVNGKKVKWRDYLGVSK